MQSNVREIIIAGADAVAGATAAAAAVSLQGSGIGITLLLWSDAEDSRSIEILRGGPRGFHTLLGLDEAMLFRQTSAVYGMGTRYRGLLDSGKDIFVPLGTHGKTLRLVDFHHYVAKLRAEDGAQEFNDWSAAAAAAQTGRFDPAQTGVEPALRLSEYDLYVDHDSYLEAVLKHASSLGVRIVRQQPVNVGLNAAGMLESLTLTDDSVLQGDFFIDCSKDRSLIGPVAAGDRFRDWSSWISCDRLISLPAKLKAIPDLFVSTEAIDSGWMSRLATRKAITGTFSYDRSVIDDEEAVVQLADWLPGASSDDANLSRFRPGRYARHWERNCVAIGPAAAALPPIEVSPLQLAHNAILRLLAMLPRRKNSSMLAAEFNRITNLEIDSVRDYQLLRLAVADRQTGPFWQRIRHLQWPDSLQQRVELFRSCGRFTPRDNEFFSKSNWISSFINFGVWPASYDPLADMVDEQRMRADLVRFKKIVPAGTQRFLN